MSPPESWRTSSGSWMWRTESGQGLRMCHTVGCQALRMCHGARRHCQSEVVQCVTGGYLKGQQLEVEAAKFFRTFGIGCTM
eukprot:4286831-Pyramimonas_sp.AAC.2